MIRIMARAQHLVVMKGAALTSGSVGERCEFIFDSAWDGLTKAAVFTAGDECHTVLLTGDSCEVPWECLQTAFIPLTVAIYGHRGTRRVLASDYAELQITEGAEPEDDETTDPTLAVWAQLQQYKQDKLTAGDNITIDEDGVIAAAVTAAVASVNGKVGTVTLNASDVGAQPAIADLTTIRSGAAAGATALQAVPNTYRTAAAQDAIHDATKQDKLTAGNGIVIAGSTIATAEREPLEVVEDDDGYILIDGDVENAAEAMREPFIIRDAEDAQLNMRDYYNAGAIDSRAFAVGETLTYASVATTDYTFFRIECEVGDTFDIYYRIKSTNVNRTYYAFTDDDDVIISVGNDSGTDGEHKTVNGLATPDGATRFYFWTYGNVNNYTTHSKCTKHSKAVYDYTPLYTLAAKELPYYYTSGWLLERIEAVREKTKVLNGCCFGFITDMHFAANSGKSKLLLQKMLDSTSVNYCICGGDYPEASGSVSDVKDAGELLLEYIRFTGNRLLPMHGNHDFNAADTGGRVSVSKAYAYDYIVRPIEGSVDFVPGKLYWSKDVGNTRLIGIDGWENYPPESNPSNTCGAWITQEQYDWFGERLRSANGKKVIVFSHSALNNGMRSYVGTHAPVHNMLVAFKNRNTFTFSRTGTLLDGVTYSISVAEDFTACTGELVCVISGHSHYDESLTVDGILNISTTCDAHYNDDGHGAQAGTVSEQAFDVYCIDYDNRTINTVRFGRGSSRAFSY